MAVVCFGYLQQASVREDILKTGSPENRTNGKEALFKMVNQ